MKKGKLGTTQHFLNSAPRRKKKEDEQATMIRQSVIFEKKKKRQDAQWSDWMYLSWQSSSQWAAPQLLLLKCRCRLKIASSYLLLFILYFLKNSRFRDKKSDWLFVGYNTSKQYQRRESRDEKLLPINKTTARWKIERIWNFSASLYYRSFCFK